MAKIGRNDPCFCGSGKKYKRCCLAKVEEAERLAFAAQEAALPRTGLAADTDEEEELVLELTLASNVVVDMVEAGQLDDAEQAAYELLQRFPDAHDGYDRLGMVYEARGDNRQAAEYYRKALAFVREHADDYDPEFEDLYLKLIERVEPPAAAG
jgi:tetratricopeptide (TPR) repeat protein